MKKITTLLMVMGLCAGCAYPGSKMDPTTAGGQPVSMVEITPSVLRDQILADRGQLATNNARELATLADPYVYRIGPQDVLTITVWDHPELTIPAGEFRNAEAAGHLVADDGTIFYPFIGQISVMGMTVQEIRDMLTQRLSRQIRNPQLDVRVAAFRSQRAYVVGEVTNPGVLPITDIALTALEAVSQSGDVTPNSDMTNVTLTRGGITYDIDLVAMYEGGRINENVVLQHGDILSIPDRNLQKVFVLGAVSRPQTQLIHKGRLTLAEAISDAGGFDEQNANATEVYVVRGDSRDPRIFHLDARSPGALILADEFRLAARDVVYVETAGQTRLADRLDLLARITRSINDLADARVRVINDLN